MRAVRLVYPHQLHAAQLEVDQGTRIVVVDVDLPSLEDYVRQLIG